jgi:hypothetical protein
LFLIIQLCLQSATFVAKLMETAKVESKIVQLSWTPARNPLPVMLW